MTTRPMDPDEMEIADQSQRLADALAAESFYTNVFYAPDGEEGWHITIQAGETRYRNDRGETHEFVLVFWTRDATWYWERTDEDGAHTGPWPSRTLDGGAPVAEVVAAVRVEVGR